MTHASDRSLLALGLLAFTVAGCASEEDDALSKELAVFESKLSSGATPEEACKELEVLCNTTGFGCKAHDLFCKVPTKEYICQQLAAACTSYPAACDVYNDHCASGPTTDAGPVPKDRSVPDGEPIKLDRGWIPVDGGPIKMDACTAPPEQCCEPHEMECRGHPDDGVVCKCSWAWTDDGGQVYRDASQYLPDASPYYADAAVAADQRMADY